MTKQWELPFNERLKRPTVLQRLRMSPYSMRDLKAPHPHWKRLLGYLEAVDFATRFDDLCSKYPHRGPEQPMEVRRNAMATCGRSVPFVKWSKTWNYREKDPTRVPRKCGLGVDFNIDARVECELVFATPHGYLGASFPRLARNVIRLKNPDFQPRRMNPAPRIAEAGELPSMVADCLALYDVAADAIRVHDWVAL